jgi:26S proteasome regulatory subunit N1
MANEGERSTSADKGKGKVEDVRELNGKKPQGDEKVPAEGKKKDEEPQEGELRHGCGAEQVVSATHSFPS